MGKPVEHVREIRSLFLLKVVLSQRDEIDLEPLLVAQRAIIVPLMLLLEAQLDDVEPAGPGSEATMLRFRLETTRSIVRFIDIMLDDLKNRSGRRTRPTPAPG